MHFNGRVYQSLTIIIRQGASLVARVLCRYLRRRLTSGEGIVTHGVCVYVCPPNCDYTTH